MKKVKLILFFIFILALAFLVYFVNSASKTEAQSQNVCTSGVCGTAVIYNTSGLIYFSGPNANGGSVQYNNGILTGYAWSPEYGWIQFKNDGTALALSLQNPNDTESPTDWANGVINLHGSNGGTTGNMVYDVVFDPTTGSVDPVNHWAWGGNVLGWIDFSGVRIPPTGTPSCTITPPISSILHGDTINLYWSGSNITSCVASNGWSGSKPISGNSNVSPSSTTTYKLTCLGTDMITSVSCSAKVNVNIYPNCNGGNLIPQISGTNCGIVNCPACEECPPGQVLLPNGNCGTPPPPNTCTDTDYDYTIDQTGALIPNNPSCYCSIHRTEITPFDCVTFCLNNPSSCKKVPHYKED